MSNDSQAELLPPEEKTPQDFPLLRIATPMEAMAEFLDAIVKDHESAIVWADKCVIDSPASRDEARMARKELKATITAIEAKRLLALKPLDNFRDDFLALCREKCQKMEDAIAVYDDKGVAYNTECKRIEAEEKARAQAARRAEEERIAAERRQREAEEEKIRLQEAERVAKIKAEAEKAAKAEGEKATAKAQAEEAANRERARIEADRAARERAEAERQAAEEAEKDRLRQETATKMAIATGQGKTKGVKTDWVIEVVDESQVPRQFCTYDPKKARNFLKAGLATEKDELKIIPGLRCYTVMAASGR